MLQTLLILAIAWVAIVLLVYAIIRFPLSNGPSRNPMDGFLWYVTKLFAGVLHPPKVVGRDRWPDRDALPDGLIVIANHTGAVDPLLLQAITVLHIRWMMSEDMMFERLNPLWKQQRIISVDRVNGDSSALRTGIRHVREGGVLGIFPEGRIVSPPGEIRPFAPGVGMIVARTKAPVVMCWISNTRPSTTIAGSLWRPSRPHIEIFGEIELTDRKKPKVITQELREIMADRTGWPLNDEELPPLEITATA
ncbi:MAG: lysophospholipid acyltransferase family protein [Planctomycetota bacterium]